MSTMEIQELLKVMARIEAKVDWLVAIATTTRGPASAEVAGVGSTPDASDSSEDAASPDRPAGFHISPNVVRTATEAAGPGTASDKEHYSTPPPQAGAARDVWWPPAADAGRHLRPTSHAAAGSGRAAAEWDLSLAAISPAFPTEFTAESFWSDVAEDVAGLGTNIIPFKPPWRPQPPEPTAAPVPTSTPSWESWTDQRSTGFPEQFGFPPCASVDRMLKDNKHGEWRRGPTGGLDWVWCRLCNCWSTESHITGRRHQMRLLWV